MQAGLGRHSNTLMAQQEACDFARTLERSLNSIASMAKRARLDTESERDRLQADLDKALAQLVTAKEGQVTFESRE